MQPASVSLSLSSSSSAWSSWILIQIVKCALVLYSLQEFALGQDIGGPRYLSTKKSCSTSEECNQALGEVCWWSYDGCTKGECRCDPRDSYLDSSNFCRPLKLGDESCGEGDKCPDGMSCQGEVCRCDVGDMTTDKTFCLKRGEKELGQKCTYSKDICYQKASHGYTRSEASCSTSGVCRCIEGYKQDAGGCRKWNVYEPGCSKDHHCQGGALCIDATCKCPSGYLAVAGDSKCAKKGAKYDLGISETCDEINERRYCGRNLICHRCAGEVDYSCVQFVYTRLEVNSGPTTRPSTLPGLISILISLIFSFR